MVQKEVFQQFTIYKKDISKSFVYANFDNPDIFMDGLADYILSEGNLLNYANSLTPIEFTPTPTTYKKLYATLGSFLNSELEHLTFDNVSNEVKNALGEEYKFIDVNGKTCVQKDKIGKIGEYILHLIMSRYYKVNCIIPKFRCTTDRNMSVFGIDSLFFDPEKNVIFFGESKVCKNIDNAITLVNRSLKDYEQQIDEEYKLVLSNEEAFNLSNEFKDAFQQYTNICISFKNFIAAASIQKIGVPVFIAHGDADKNTSIEDYLDKMNSKLNRSDFFGIDTEYIFISLPIIDKTKIMDIIMKKVVKKSNEYRDKLSKI